MPDHPELQVSVVIPSYNHERFVEEAIRSVHELPRVFLIKSGYRGAENQAEAAEGRNRARASKISTMPTTSRAPQRTSSRRRT